MSKLMLILASMKLWKVKFTWGLLKLTFKTSSSLDSSKTESYNQAQKYKYKIIQNVIYQIHGPHKATLNGGINQIRSFIRDFSQEISNHNSFHKSNLAA